MSVKNNIGEHPLASLFPAMTEGEFAGLKDDIKQHGLREPVWVMDGKLIDGRHRLRACNELDIKCPSREYGGTDALSFVVSLNMARRHLDTSQRAMVAARIANMSEGRPKTTSENPLVSQTTAASTMNTSVDSVKLARKVIELAEPEIIAAVDAGTLPVSQAAKLANTAPEFQRAVAKRISENAKPTAAVRQTIAETTAANELKAPSGKFRVFYADPPWSYGNTMPDYAPEQRDHYPVMSMADLCAMPVKEMSADNAVLFLWVTSPILEESFALIKAWGFKYKSSFVWDKVKHNMGHYNSVRHEFLLICVRGSCQPDVRKLFDSVITEERTEHSRKPSQVYEIIETIYTSGPYIELFARTQRKGWKSHGYETSKFSA